MNYPWSQCFAKRKMYDSRLRKISKEAIKEKPVFDAGGKKDLVYKPRQRFLRGDGKKKDEAHQAIHTKFMKWTPVTKDVQAKVGQVLRGGSGDSTRLGAGIRILVCSNPRLAGWFRDVLVRNIIGVAESRRIAPFFENRRPPSQFGENAEIETTRRTPGATIAISWA